MMMESNLMEYCPICNNLLNWYLRSGCSGFITGYHCYKCGYDSNNVKYTVSTSSTPYTIDYTGATPGFSFNPRLGDDNNGLDIDEVWRRLSDADLLKMYVEDQRKEQLIPNSYPSVYLTIDDIIMKIKDEIKAALVNASDKNVSGTDAYERFFNKGLNKALQIIDSVYPTTSDEEKSKDES